VAAPLKLPQGAADTRCMDLSTYGLPVLELVRLTGVHVDTARRWKRAGQVPARYGDLLTLRRTGDLGVLAPDWAGFRLDGSQLWTPENARLRPGDLRAIPYRREQLRELERQLAEPQQRSLF
jgi:Phage protein